MTFGAVACSRCGRVQAVELGGLRTRCRACGASQKLSTDRILERAEDERSVQLAVARHSARRSGAHVEIQAEAVGAAEAERHGRLEDLLSDLRKLPSHFDAVAFEEAHSRLRVVGDPENLLGRLLEGGVLFEPRPGRYGFM